MIGNSDSNRSEGQGGFREELSAKEVRSKGTTIGTRTGREAVRRAISVRESAKSKGHRKTHRVEPDGTGRKFMRLTRGDLPCESKGGAGRGHSSEESRRGGRNGSRAKRNPPEGTLGKNRGQIAEGELPTRSRQSGEIPKPHGGVRTLGIPNVQDRLIQQAIHQQLSPLWEADFSDHSHGFRPHRSAHDAVREARGYIKSGKRWVADIDLKSFFDEVDHDKLMRQVGRKVRDKRLLRLIGDYLRAPMKQPDGSRRRRTKGTPQGGPLSPLLANILLDPLDRELEGRGLSFVRYADDVAIFASSERAAERILDSVTGWIEKHLKVPVNREKSGSGPTDESALLGFRLFSDGRVGVSPESVRRRKEKVRQLWEAGQSLTSEQLRDQWQRYIRGWWNYFQLANWRREVYDLSGWIRRHMRKCFWLRWKTPRGRIKALKRLGVRGRALGNGYCRKGAWAMAIHYVMHQLNKLIRAVSVC